MASQEFSITQEQLLTQFSQCILHGLSHFEIEHGEAAVNAFEQALSLLEQAEKHAPLPVGTTHAKYGTLLLLGYSHACFGYLDAARQHVDSAHHLTTKVTSAMGESLTQIKWSGTIFQLIGDIERDAGQPGRARVMYEESLKLYQQIRAVAGDLTDTLQDVSQTLRRLADLERNCGRLEQARPMYEEALQLDRQIGKRLGDSAETLSSLSVSLHRLADLHRESGQLDLARPLVEEAHKLIRQVCTEQPNSPDMLQAEFGSLYRLIRLEREAGRHEPALRLSRDALWLGRKLRALSGNNFIALTALIESLVCIADLELDAGRPEQARPLYEEALSLDRLLPTEPSDPMSVLRIRSISLDRLADLELAVGQTEKARCLYDKARDLKVQIYAQAGDNPDALREISISLERLADLEVAADRLEHARPMYEQALKQREKLCIQQGESPEALRDLSIILERLSDLDRKSGLSNQAVLKSEQALKLIQQRRALLGDRPDTLREESVRLVHLSRLVLEDAQAAYQKPHRSIQAEMEDKPNTELDQWHFLHQQAAWIKALNIGISSVTKAAELAILAASSRVERPISDMYGISVMLTDIARIFQPAREQAWLLYERMASKVNAYFEFNDPESTVRARPYINGFHALWLGLALDTGAQRLPAVLGAAQGRKVSALILHELQRQVSVGSASDELRELWIHRERLNYLSLTLGVGAFVGRSAFGDLVDMQKSKRSEESSEVTRTRTQALWAEHRIVLGAYETAQAALIAKHPTLRELHPESSHFQLSQLQLGLSEDSALLLLIQAPEDGSASRPQRTYAFLVRAKGTPQLQPLPGLDALPEKLRLQRDKLACAGRGVALDVRECQGSFRQSVHTQPPPDVTNAAALDVSLALHKSLWAVLNGDAENRQQTGEKLSVLAIARHLHGSARNLLAGLRQLHVVSHGDLHGLPLALGAPEGLTVSLYPGLVYYWLQRQRGALVWPATRQLLYQFYSPEDDLSGTADSAHALAPIPHVETEAALVGSCWAERDELLRRGRNDADGSAPTVLHLGCHGTLEREGQEDPCLILADEHRLNLIELLQGSPSAPIVYLSACMVGRTREDLDGDPLGLVGGFMLRGARCVIAALNPISDFYAPLLAYLFHRCLQAQAQAGQPLDAVGALAQAKEQLRSGDWGNGEEQAQQAVIEAYAPRLQQQLEQAIRDSGSNALVPEDWWPAQLQGWLAGLIPALGTDTFNLALELAQLLEAKLIRSEAATTDVTAGRMVAQQFVAARAKLYSSTPAVQHLLVDVQAFG